MRHAVILSGDRDWDDPLPVEFMIRGLRNRWGARRGYGAGLLVVHGAAPGLDSVAEDLCERMNVDTDPNPADWNRYGPSAGPRRNGEMLKKYLASKDCHLSLCVGFHNDIMSKTPRGNKRGTRDMLDRASNAGVPTLLVSNWPRIS